MVLPELQHVPEEAEREMRFEVLVLGGRRLVVRDDQQTFYGLCCSGEVTVVV